MRSALLWGAGSVLRAHSTLAASWNLHRLSLSSSPNPEPPVIGLSYEFLNQKHGENKFSQRVPMSTCAGQFLLSAKDTWEEGLLIEELPLSNWLMTVSVRSFDC